MTNTTIELHHADYAKAKAFMDGWDAGFKWAHELKVGDLFNGAHGEAKQRYTDEYAISAFTSAAYREVRKMSIYVNDNGIITKLLKN